MSKKFRDLVRAAGEAALVCLHPAGGVVLLQEVSWRGQGVTIILCQYVQTAPCGSSKQSLWKGRPLRLPLTPPSHTQVGWSRTVIFIVLPDLEWEM